MPLFVRPQQNENGTHDNMFLSSGKPVGMWLEVPEELEEVTDMLLPFVNIEHDGKYVTKIEDNADARSAYKPPEPPKPTPTTEEINRQIAALSEQQVQYDLAAVTAFEAQLATDAAIVSIFEKISTTTGGTTV